VPLLNAIVSLRHLLIAAVFTAFAGISQGQTTAPSFDCTKANMSEAAICADPDLASRDRAMAELYPAALPSAAGVGVSREQAAQRSWLKFRSNACTKTPEAKCLSASYDVRLKELAVAALFNSPDAALGMLRRLDPNSAPIYEAIYRYATIVDPAERAATVEKLIGPIFDAIHTEPGVEEFFKNIPTAHDAAASDDAFSTFLQIASVSDFSLTLPCGAMLRRPGLISALRARFGSSMDGRLLNSDCGTTLPERLEFSKLEQAAINAQPPCEGTIRFALGRGYEQMLVKIWLHRLDRLEAGIPEMATDDNSKQFRAGHAGMAEAAKAELAKYYSDIFKVPPDTARHDALGAVNAVIHGAFNLCE
jgi:uncharacterized protein